MLATLGLVIDAVLLRPDYHTLPISIIHIGDDYLYHCHPWKYIYDEFILGTYIMDATL